MLLFTKKGDYFTLFGSAAKKGRTHLLLLTLHEFPHFNLIFRLITSFALHLTAFNQRISPLSLLFSAEKQYLVDGHLDIPFRSSNQNSVISECGILHNLYRYTTIFAADTTPEKCGRGTL